VPQPPRRTSFHPWFPQSRAGLVCAVETWLVSLFLVLFLHVGSSPYLAFALAGSFFCHLYLRRNLAESLTAILAGLSYAAAYLLFLHPYRQYVGFGLGAAGAFLGCGSLGVMALKLPSATPQIRPALKEALVTAALVPVLCSLSLWAVSLVARFTRLSYDFELYRFDRSLGVDTFRLARAWLAYPQLYRGLYSAAAFVYNALPLYVAACLALVLRRGEPLGFRRSVVALGAIGFGLYQVCPAAGPLYRFPCFPACLPSLADVPALPSALSAPAMNAMPSLHLAWTLLCLLYIWRLGNLARMLAVSVALFTAAATLLSGEHYVVDLIVALPLTVAIRGAFYIEASLPRRLTICGSGLAMVLAWVVSGRLGLLALSSPELSRILAAATVRFSGLAAIWTCRRARPNTSPAYVR
jgi:hypothetical protein